MARWFAVPLLVGAVALVHHATESSGGEPARTRLTIWSAAAAAESGYGGYSYGGAPPSESVLVQEQREVDVGATGEVRVGGIASTADAGSVQLRDLTEPTAVIAEQRFIPAATSPTALLVRNLGEQVTAITAKGEVTGILRSADEDSLVIESGTGTGRQLSVLRRDAVSDIKLPVAAAGEPTFAWRLDAKKPGKHTIDLAYRATGISWSADYLAVMDEGGKAIDFSAWATVRNDTGTTFDRAALTLVEGSGGDPNGEGRMGPRPAPSAARARFAIASPVRLVNGTSVQVELVPSRAAIKVTPVVSYESMPDPSGSFQSYPAADCTQFNGSSAGTGTASLAVEIAVPGIAALPAGRVRLFRRAGEHLDMVNEEPLHTGPGVARVSISTNAEITGERHAIACDVDESARTITERVQVKVSNKGLRSTDVIVREFAWRWPVYTLTAEDAKSAHPAPQTLEYRMAVPSKGTKSVTYSVRYTW